MFNRFRTYINRPGLGPIVVKTVIGSAGLRLVGMVFGFLVGVQLARGLGAEGYGVYGLAMSIIALLTVPTEFGLPLLVTREVAVAQAEGNFLKLRGILRWAMRTSLLISLGVAAVVLGWLIISGHGIGSPLGETLLIGILMVPLVAQCNLNSSALRGLQHIVKGQLPDILLRPLLFSLLLFVWPFLYAPLSPVFAMGLGAASAALAFISASLLLHKELPKSESFAEATIDTKTWWSSALPMALSEAMRLLQGHLAILLLGLMTTVAMVGVYRVASSVVLLIALPISLFNVVSAPIISRLFSEGDHPRLQRLLIWISLGMTLSMIGLTLPFLVKGKYLLGTVFGNEFAGGHLTLLLLCVGIASHGLFGVTATLLNMTGHQNRVTRASCIALLFLLISMPPLIWFTGIEGAAISSSLSLIVWNYIMWRDALRLLILNSSCIGFFHAKE